MEEYTLTTEAIEAIIRLAFTKGVTHEYKSSFHVAYHTPQNEAQDIAVNEILTQIKNELEG
jgi:hypothetical protein